MAWPKQLVVGSSPLSPGVNARVFMCDFWGGRMAVGHVFRQVLLFSGASIIPPMLHTHSFMYHQRYTVLEFGSIVKYKPLSLSCFAGLTDMFVIEVL